MIHRSSFLVYIILCIPFINYLYAVQNYFIAWFANNNCLINCGPLAKTWCTGELYSGIIGVFKKLHFIKELKYLFRKYRTFAIFGIRQRTQRVRRAEGIDLLGMFSHRLCYFIYFNKFWNCGYVSKYF